MGYAKQYYRLDEVAELLSVSVRTLQIWARNGKVESIKTIGGHYRISGQALRRFGATANA